MTGSASSGGDGVTRSERARPQPPATCSTATQRRYEAPDRGRRARHQRRSGRKHLEDLAKIAGRGRRPRAAEVDVAIVDPSPVDHAWSGGASHEHGRLRRHRRLGRLHQLVLRITQGLEPQTEIALVTTDHLRRLRGIRIHEPERHSLAGEMILQPPQLRRIAVRDRAVGPHEDQDGRPPARTRQGVHHVSGQVQHRRQSEGCRPRHEHEKREATPARRCGQTRPSPGAPSST